MAKSLPMLEDEQKKRLEDQIVGLLHTAVEQGFRDESPTMLEQKIRALLAPR